MSNKELQRQEIKPLVISEKERFDLAKGSVKIIDATDEEIRQALRYAMVKIGLRAANFPQGIEKVLLIQHVYQNFPENTPDEIRLAFDWAISGRVQEDYNCFENFSCAYFSRIMNAYNSLASKVEGEKREVKELPAPELKSELYNDFLNTPFADKLRQRGIKLPD